MLGCWVLSSRSRHTAAQEEEAIKASLEDQFRKNSLYGSPFSLAFKVEWEVKDIQKLARGKEEHCRRRNEECPRLWCTRTEIKRSLLWLGLTGHGWWQVSGVCICTLVRHRRDWKGQSQGFAHSPPWPLSISSSFSLWVSSWMRQLWSLPHWCSQQHSLDPQEKGSLLKGWCPKHLAVSCTKEMLNKYFWINFRNSKACTEYWIHRNSQYVLPACLCLYFNHLCSTKWRFGDLSAEQSILT